MKRLNIRILCILFLCLFATPAFAMDFLVGAKAGYYIWEPFYKDDFGPSGMNEIDYGSGVLAGPIVSLLITPDITFSLAGLAGRQSTHWQTLNKEYSFESGNKRITGGYYFDALRVDIDSALSYRLSDMFKVFVGYKFLYLKADYNYTEHRSTIPANELEEINTTDATFITPFHGPALGIGFSIPLSERVFISANVSGVYMIGHFDDDGAVTYNYNSGDNFTTSTKREDDFEKTDMKQFGLNVEPVIGFNPGNGLPLISLGFRFQWLRVYFSEGSDQLPSDWFNDYLYGVFISAVYTI